LIIKKRLVMQASGKCEKLASKPRLNFPGEFPGKEVELAGERIDERLSEPRAHCSGISVSCRGYYTVLAGRALTLLPQRHDITVFVTAFGHNAKVSRGFKNSLYALRKLLS